MHPQHNPGGASAPSRRAERSPQEIYESEQRGLLDLLLKEFPGVLTHREALVARVDDPEDFGQSDRFGNAARGLVASGLVIRQGELVIPSRPAREMVVLGWELG
ncbi:MAG: hypothetical protein JST59_25735 [Actinobacteria bacterium]|nr:hypothetical protein [Actinomycetota bacterium]